MPIASKPNAGDEFLKMPPNVLAITARVVRSLRQMSHVGGVKARPCVAPGTCGLVCQSKSTGPRGPIGKVCR